MISSKLKLKSSKFVQKLETYILLKNIKLATKPTKFIIVFGFKISAHCTLYVLFGQKALQIYLDILKYLSFQMDKIKSMAQKTYSAKHSNINVYSTCKFWIQFVESFPFNAKFHTQNKNTQK